MLGLALAPAIFAQTPPRPAFEAAAIHLHQNCREEGRGPGSLTSGRLRVSCISIRTLIRVAYGAFGTSGRMLSRRVDVIGGPGWLDSELYSLDAKAEGAASLDQTAGGMLQTLLEDRCKLKIHHEAHETPVYVLTIAKGGAKLKESTPDSCKPFDLSHPAADPHTVPCGVPVMGIKAGDMVADGHGMTMAEFAARMLRRVDRPVIDKTGLTGRYDFHLEYAISGPMRINGEAAPGASVLANPAGASMLSAVQSQLGLRLSPDKASTDVIVVDSVERPSEN
jgi:uncharacterized protein (TIGR03435 family)